MATQHTTQVTARLCVFLVLMLLFHGVSSSQQRRTMANGGSMSVSSGQALRGSLGIGFYLRSQAGPVLIGDMGVLKVVSVHDGIPLMPTTIHLSPNPAKDLLLVKLPDDVQWVDVLATDIIGRTYTLDMPGGYPISSTWSVDVSSLPVGWYIVSARGQGTILSSSLFIHR